MPQPKQTKEEKQKVLERRLELMKDEPIGRGDNVDLTEEDERILVEIYDTNSLESPQKQ